MSGNAIAGDLVDVAPLREAFEASGLSLSTVCRRLGWYCNRPDGRTADTARLRRALGTQRQGGVGRDRYLNRRIGYDLALRIAVALDLDPVDVGL